MVGEGKELLRQTIYSLSRRISPRLESFLTANPDILDQLLDAVVGAIRAETHSALSGLTRLKDDRLTALATQATAAIDDEALVARVMPLLASKLAEWFERDAAVRAAIGEAVAQEFMKHLDLEEFAHEVADQVSARVARQVSVTLPQQQA